MNTPPNNTARLTEVETAWIARHRIALAALYSAVLADEDVDEEVDEQDESRSLPARADRLRTSGETRDGQHQPSS